MRCLSLTTLLLLPSLALAQQKGKPQVLLMGDSIRLGYAPLVEKKLDGVAEVFSFPENGGDTNSTLKQLDAWAKARKAPFNVAKGGSAPPMVVHFSGSLLLGNKEIDWSTILQMARPELCGNV